MGIIALIVFWGAIARLWLADGPRLPLIFIVLWIVGILVLPRFTAGGYVVVAYEAILAVIVLMIGQFKSA